MNWYIYSVLKMNKFLLKSVRNVPRELMSLNNLRQLLSLGPEALVRQTLISVQGVGWTTLSILSILCYNGVIDNGDIQNYGYLLYDTFHSDFNISAKANFTEHPDVIITAEAFNIIMYFYAVLSFVWIWISSALIWGMVRDKWNNMVISIQCWVGVTISISALDLVVVCLLLADCYNLFNKTDITIDDPVIMIYQAVYGIVISLAAKGYALWIFNVSFGIVLAKVVTQMQKEDKPVRLSVIDAFATSTVPRFDTGRINEGYVQDDGDRNSRSERSSFNPLSNISLDSGDNIKFSKPMFEYPKPNRSEADRVESIQYSRQNTSLSDIKYSTFEPPKFERVAKIGKYNGGQRTPPQNVSPPSIPRLPYIPPPDYTPPSSPKSQPKSVLRSQRKYLY